MDVFDRYIKEIRKAFPVYGGNEKKFISDMKDSLTEYYNSNPNISYEEFLREFGEPKTVTMTYFENISNEEYYLLLKRARFIRFSMVTIFLTIIIALSIMLVYWINACNYAKKNTVTNVEYVISEVMNEKNNETGSMPDNDY